MNSYIIGIDIGGTNTDAVLVDRNQKLIGAVKTSTTSDISIGFIKAIQQLLKETKVNKSDVALISLGTTHAVNAILQCCNLYKVGVLRIAGQNPKAIPSCFGWPMALKAALYAGTETIHGGFDCQGNPITSFKEKEALEAIERLLEKGAESLAVIGVFAPLNPQQEVAVEALIKHNYGTNFPVSISNQVGSIGYIERENTTILNSALKKVMAEGFAGLKALIHKEGLTCPLFITQNNGSLTTLEHAIANPILTISSGQTNSFIGASRLGNLSDAMIVDVGGTSTDIGMIKQGIPKRSLNTSNLGGVKLNFSMPDVLSIAIGGGSRTIIAKDDSVIIGPESVSKELCSRACSFGGDVLTLTDAALCAGSISIAGARPEKAAMTDQQAALILGAAMQKIKHFVALMAGNKAEMPVLLVGGGAALFPKAELGNSFIIPPYAHVANAYGSALAEIVGMVDKVVSLQGRSAAIEKLQEEAVSAAILRGADPKSTRIVDVEIIPYHYTSNQMARVIISASGPHQFAIASHGR